MKIQEFILLDMNDIHFVFVCENDISFKRDDTILIERNAQVLNSCKILN